MYRPHIRGRRRILNSEMQAELCRLISEGASLESAADTLNVSLRTVQRNRRDDEDFDHELRLSLQAPPDPKEMMEQAARTHWRAAAWLLERTNPETYARRPVNTAKPQQVDNALAFLLEAALQATPEDQRVAFFEKVSAAREQAFDCVFPNLGLWGNPRSPKCPPSPLTDYLTAQQRLATARVLPDYDEAGNVIPPTPLAPLPSFEEVQAAAAARAAEELRREAKLRDYREGLRIARDPSEYAEPIDPDDDDDDDAASACVGGIPDADSDLTVGGVSDAEGILSPKIDFATEFPTPYVRLSSLTAPANDQAPPQVAEEDNQPQPLHPSPGPVRLESLTYDIAAGRQALADFRRRQQAKKERAAAKRLKAAKRRARRRAA